MVDTVPSLQDIDLGDLDLYQRGAPHDLFTMLRKQAPVFWHKGSPRSRNMNTGFWAITKYDDVFRISRDPRGFSSARPSIAGPTNLAGPDLADHPRGQSLPLSDPPKHGQLRRLVNKSFSSREVVKVEAHVRDIVRIILNDVCERGEVDFVEDIAAKLPLAVICEMMGVPKEDRQFMFDLTNRIFGGSDPEFRNQDQPPTPGVLNREMLAYLRKMMEGQRGHSEDDLMAIIVRSEIEGERTSELDALELCRILIGTGISGTRIATTGGMLAFIEHPEQRAKLAADLSLIPSATEEVLRWATPLMQVRRLCTADTQIRGQPIKAGERVVMWYPSANRDEDIFSDPFSFDITRTPNDHLAFGVGEHFCLGSHLARLELQVMFEQLFKRLPDIELAGDIQRLRSDQFDEIKHMPVRFTPTAPIVD